MTSCAEKADTAGEMNDKVLVARNEVVAFLDSTPHLYMDKNQKGKME